ncbi:hypothetical protein [Glacieibacterium frigidum]|uniref:Uncharacterized protein n=1 Tax=Glacieibacterium frigidum TaxID=2593303 RepID=A0A552UFN3_9SPHN|nr:hypothetical protein [Glacieibacterium frigidum]TRW17036.1 hypothetical protein FMM06_02170 [Glacieibacterium frigidum]
MRRYWPILLILAAAPCAAQPGTVYRLTPDEIAKASKAPAVDPLFDRSLFDETEVRRDRRVHGEVGAFVGTGGARGVFGTAEMPLGDKGFAAFSFEHSDYGRERQRRR